MPRSPSPYHFDRYPHESPRQWLTRLSRFRRAKLEPADFKRLSRALQEALFFAYIQAQPVSRLRVLKELLVGPGKPA